MNFTFKTYNDFLREYQTYHTYACPKCGMPMELTLIPALIEIDDIKLTYEELYVLECIECHSTCLPEYSKEIIGGCYQATIDHGEKMESFGEKTTVRDSIIV